jgi:hypothetical protein
VSNTVFCSIIPRSSEETRRFGETYRTYLQRLRVRKEKPIEMWAQLVPASADVLLGLTILPWRWKSILSRNMELLPKYSVVQRRRTLSSWWRLWKPHIKNKSQDDIYYGIIKLFQNVLNRKNTRRNFVYTQIVVFHLDIFSLFIFCG